MGADLPEPPYLGDELLFIWPGGRTQHETVPWMSGETAFVDSLEEYFGGPVGEAYKVKEYIDHEQSAFWLYEAIEPKYPAINLTATRFLDRQRTPRAGHVWGEAVIRWPALRIEMAGQVII